MTRLLIAALLLAAAAASAPPAVAQEGRPTGWSGVKCERYARAWSDLLARRGRGGLSQDFVERHDAFLASGCTAKGDVCPRSAAELEVANIMVVLAMNAGTASTFPPFACRP